MQHQPCRCEISQQTKHVILKILSAFSILRISTRKLPLQVHRKTAGDSARIPAAHQGTCQTLCYHQHHRERHLFDCDKGNARSKSPDLKYFVDICRYKPSHCGPQFTVSNIFDKSTLMTHHSNPVALLLSRLNFFASRQNTNHYTKNI